MSVTVTDLLHVIQTALGFASDIQTLLSILAASTKARIWLSSRFKARAPFRHSAGLPVSAQRDGAPYGWLLIYRSDRNFATIVLISPTDHRDRPAPQVSADGACPIPKR
jgi:hypothetical protein